MAPTLPLVATLCRLSRADLHEYTGLLQMRTLVQDDVTGATDSECACPGYFEDDCRAHEEQGCTWTDAGDSNAPWCQCNAEVWAAWQEQQQQQRTVASPAAIAASAAPDALPPTQALPAVPVCVFTPGDGSGPGGANEDCSIGNAASGAECAAMCRAQFPTSNGATHDLPEGHHCCCEFYMTFISPTIPGWQTCFFEDFVQPSLPECQEGHFVLGDGEGGTDEYLADAASPQECVRMVKEQRPTANGASLSIHGTGHCKAEFNMDHTEYDTVRECGSVADCIHSVMGEGMQDRRLLYPEWQTCQFA